MTSALWYHGPGGAPRGSGIWGTGQVVGGFLGNKISTINHSLTSSKHSTVCCFSGTAVMIALRAQIYQMRLNIAFVA